MIKKYKIITLCGSTRFIGVFSHDSNAFKNMDNNTIVKTKEMLDDMHKRKIDMSDEIFVINVGGYIGESTKSEIEYAIKNHKKVNYLETNI